MENLFILTELELTKKLSITHYTDEDIDFLNQYDW